MFSETHQKMILKVSYQFEIIVVVWNIERERLIMPKHFVFSVKFLFANCQFEYFNA